MSVSSESQNVFLQWAFKLNNAPATAEIWDLKGCALNINHFPFMIVLLVSNCNIM
jgi:hypothetical protein